MEEEKSNIGESNAESNKPFDKVAYQRELMRKKRAAEKARVEHREDREGRVDPSGVEVDVVALPEPIAVNLTRTDRKFENHRPGYWIYGKEVKERECWKCGDKFETRLEMNKFCGPKCKEQWLSDAFGKLRSQSKANL